MDVSSKISKAKRKADKQFIDHFVNTQNSIVKVMNSTLKKMRKEADLTKKYVVD